MSSTPSRTNSLLKLLNPYSSMSGSTIPHPDTDSPSTMLLRELQGDEAEVEGEEDPRDRERMSPTPTPTSRPSKRVLKSPSTSSEDEDGEPPRSIVFGGARDPQTPNNPIRRASDAAEVMSSGPFRQTGPSSSSASGSTSPGPSTISVYASGMDRTSRDPSTSPEHVVSPRVVPTFREPPRPGPPRRQSSGSKKVSTPSPRLLNGQGYLDPTIPSPLDRKGKVKAGDKGGRRYHTVPNGEDDEEEPHLGRYAGLGMVKGGGTKKTGLDAHEKALWKWVNVDDLDGFLQEVYAYFKGKGIYCIALARVLNLLTTFFVIAFSTFLNSCIDYSALGSTTSGTDSIGHLDDVLIGQCLTRGSFPHMLFIFSVTGFYVFQLITFALSLPRLLEMYRFYTHLLGVPDTDVQTLPWTEIVRLIGEIRKHNPVTSLSNGQTSALADMVGEDVSKANEKKLDAHDVANRILRQENYLIALFNKELLDLRVRLPVPFAASSLVPPSLLAPPSQAALPTNAGERERRFISFGANTLTKALEWNLRFCLMGYLFDQRGQVRKEFVRERRRKDLVDGLKRRFVFMGILNAIFAPFIVVYLLMYSFFRYFEEYHKNPSSIGGRQYTLYAQWKFREFNELPHLFERRLDRSYPTAKEYIDQFPKERTALIMRFVAFIAGSFAAVLLVASLIDPDLVLHFEITPHRTVLFYLGLFGSVLAIARGMVPEENLVFDPEASLREVVKWTHYLPGEWRGKLHSQMSKVHAEFGNLFALKINIFFTELLSVLLTPFILFFTLPPCAGAIIDFFREFTVHVDGVGYVCSFAVFDFRRHGKTDSAEEKERSRWRTNENKMEKSFLHFKATNPDWQPDPASSVFLDRLKDQYSGSVYATKGFGLEDASAKLKERSQRYDRAYAKSSVLLRGKLAGVGEVQEEEEDDGEEGDEEEEEEVEGWDRRVQGREEMDGEGDEGDEGFLRDVGMVGLLQQVIKR